MKVETYALIFLLAFSCPTIADEPEKEAKESEVDLSSELTPELLEQLYDFMTQEKRGFVIPPSTTVPHGDQSRLSGEWIEKDGERTCDGYLTRIESEDFCEAEIPTDWRPFEFDGRTYFVQPLADGGR